MRFERTASRSFFFLSEGSLAGIPYCFFNNSVITIVKFLSFDVDYFVIAITRVVGNYDA